MRLGKFIRKFTNARGAVKSIDVPIQRNGVRLHLKAVMQYRGWLGTRTCVMFAPGSSPPIDS